MLRCVKPVLRLLAVTTALVVLAQLAQASVHRHESSHDGDAAAHTLCAACVFAAAAPAPAATPDCPSAPFVATLDLPGAPVLRVVVAVIAQPPARGPPSLHV